MPLKLSFRARAALFALAALALVLFASGREVSASGQGTPQAPISPAPQIPTSTSTANGPAVRLSADEAVRMALENILGMLPGMGNLKQLAEQKPVERQLRRVEAIIGSMTPDERKYAEIIDGSRRKRIARGSGTAVEDVNRLLKQFVEMQRMLKMVGQMTGDPIPAPPKKKKKSPFSLMK